MMTAESRDLRVATYSEASLMGTARAYMTLTGMAGIPPGGGFCAELREHARVSPEIATAASSAVFRARM